MGWRDFFSSVVELEPHQFGGAIAATRCGSDIKIFFIKMMRLPNTFFKLFYFEHQVWCRSRISLRLRLQKKDVALAALKGYGYGCTERMRLFNTDLHNRHLQPLC
jgi:hypothetical protein